ncbi:DUF4214 domain-containing protein [Orrella daihaiensis]|uniref:DUF4214 domain-containing protein n=1 Tax=Orrella daihaiensis TaxID=2782176 RepID=A0ABY4AJG7_9BURK|nr:DUF4214 domain-containing protein [Orrella daihaiensis]UOD50428.1 DUF4214 domain-containing protein [Orrella daihaiensis]
MSVVTVEMQNQVSELYITFFGRAPDAEGMGHWVQALANGATVEEIGTAFANSPEFVSNYGGLTPAEAINKFYVNTLNRDADDAGLEYWENLIVNQGVSFATVAYSIVNTAFAGEGNPNVNQDDVALVNNKVTIAKYFSLDLASNDFALAQTAFVGIDDTQASVDAKEAELDAEVNAGTTYTLTTGIDVITGGSNGDTFIGQTGATAAETTIQAGDRINGGGGTNEFDIYLGAATMAPMTVSNVQNFYLQSIVDTTGVNFLNVSGAQQIWNNASTKDLVVTNVQSLATVGLKNVTGGPAELTTVVFNAELLEGTDNVVNIVTSGSADAGVISADDGSAGGGVETFAISAVGTNKIKTLDFGTDAKNLTISGDGNLTVTDTIANVTNIDGTAATGKLGLNSAVAKVVIATGSGADTVTLSYANAGAGVTKETSVNLGDGNDTLKITLLETAAKIAAGATFNGGEGTDVLNYAYGDLVNATTGKQFSSFEVVDLVGGGGTYELATLEANNTIGELRVSGELRAAAVANNLAKGASVDFSGADAVQQLTVNVKGATDPGSINNVLDINLAGKANVVTGVIVVDNVQTINIDSSTTATSGISSIANTIDALTAAKATSINFTGANQLTVTAFTNSTVVGLIDASEMTGKFIMTNADASTNATLILGGSAADTLRANGVDGSIVQGNSAADTIYLNTTADKVSILNYEAQSDSTGAAWDMVDGFSALKADNSIEDKIDVSFLGFTGAEATVAATSKATLTDSGLNSTFSISAANAASFFTNSGVQTGVVFQKSGTDHTFVFIDANKDGAWEAASDMAILLDGDTGNLAAGNFVFA